MQEMGGLDVRYGDVQVLEAFPDLDSSLAFQGLKRKLGMHQESLSRALRRLEGDDLVARTGDGYRLTPRGRAFLGPSQKAQFEPRRVLETYLPADISATNVIDRLKYSWFSSLRWLGYAKTEGGTVLTWLTEDGQAQIHAHFQGQRLEVDMESRDNNNEGLALRFAHQLVSRIIREYKKNPEQDETAGAAAMPAQLS